MSVRDGMASLIKLVRLLVADPVDADQQFDDQEIQDALDRRRVDVRYLRLTPAPTYNADGTTDHLNYYARYGDWEEGVELYDSGYEKQTPSTSDLITGHWVFESNVDPPVFAVGSYYDVYAAAADLLETWAAALALEYDFDADGARFSRSQKREALLALAAKHRAQQRLGVVRRRRSDMGRGETWT